MDMFYVYFLRSIKSGKIYTGFSSKKPERRLEEHVSGSTTWTRQNGPFELKYFETYCCKADAMHREKFYKSGFGRQIRDAIIQAVSAKG